MINVCIHGQDIIIKYDMILKVNYNINYAIHFNLFSAKKLLSLFSGFSQSRNLQIQKIISDFFYINGPF